MGWGWWMNEVGVRKGRFQYTSNSPATLTRCKLWLNMTRPSSRKTAVWPLEQRKFETDWVGLVDERDGGEERGSICAQLPCRPDSLQTMVKYHQTKQQENGRLAA